jgi:hypothetical protein
MYLPLSLPFDNRFNYTYSGSEDVSFEVNIKVCDVCGGRLPCSCQNCGNPHEPDEECLCRPSKRQKTDSDITGKTLSDSTEEIMSIDPMGSGWNIQTVPRRVPPNIPDTCDMVLTRNCTKVKQLFNNYGAFNNRTLLSTYGFIDPRCRTDYITLKSEIFDQSNEFFQICHERAEFWRTKGLEFIIQLADHSPGHKLELETILEGEDCPDYSFIYWSLAVGENGWVRYPLKVWVILCCLTPDEWKTVQADATAILHWLVIFETRDVQGWELDFFEKWLRRLDFALTMRYTRYQDTANCYPWVLGHEKYDAYPPGHVLPLYCNRG